MNGIENITQRIVEDARKKAAEIVAQAEQEAAVIRGAYADRCARLREDILSQATAQAAQVQERAASAGALEGRKCKLSAKQELLDETFQLALQKLKGQSPEEYIAFLSKLLTQAASGTEEVIFNTADRAQVGKAVVTAANDAMAKAVAPKVPDALNQGALGAVMEKGAALLGAVTNGTGMLTLSQETRPIQGGFILKEGLVEVNCALETLVDQQRGELTAQVAELLFPSH